MGSLGKDSGAYWGASIWGHFLTLFCSHILVPLGVCVKKRYMFRMSKNLLKTFRCLWEMLHMRYDLQMSQNAIPNRHSKFLNRHVLKLCGSFRVFRAPTPSPNSFFFPSVQRCRPRPTINRTLPYGAKLHQQCTK